ncbi:metal ABC transporter solute-binding protein, Zn/Mn family [Ruegeria sp. AU67]|uniref:metal ABC transporter solute-binding protein, Zn/Mn family n=1 Tax=Ruegeria sp. AU67 TaxID=2108530 RepID=UPI000D692C89|nr:zinc ABC transporter substrate-binding protein [Ruegeria sp. AU67]
MTLVKSLYTGIASVSFALAALPTVAAEGNVKIVASFSILGDMVEEVVGDLATVTTIVGPDADAHVYQPSVADAKAVAQADIIFVNGLGFETWSDTLIAESGTDATVHVATDGITPVTVEGKIDPHAWNSLSNGMIYVTNVADVMTEAMPEHAEEIAANAAAYIAQLEALDAETKTKLAGLPANRRTVVTAHDAFGYLADAYGLTFLAPVGIDTEAEPSAKDLAVLIDQLKADGAAALFVENITSPTLIQQISDETGIVIGGRLFSDALSERGSPATSYLAMFQHNLNTLLNALGNATAS